MPRMEIGTSDLSNYFYSHVDHDLGSKWESWYKRAFPAALEFLEKPAINRKIHEAKALLCTFIYYLGSEHILSTYMYLKAPLINFFKTKNLLQDIFKDVRFLILLALYQTVLPNIREWDLSILFGYPVPKEGDDLSLTNILFLPAWLCLVLSEVAKILTLLCQQSWTWKKGSYTQSLLPHFL